MTNFFTNAISELIGYSRSSELSDPPEKFVILTVPRTGSSYLCNALNGHPEILCHGELFHPKKIFSNTKKNSHVNLGSIQFRNFLPKRFMKRVWEQNFEYSAVGLKLFPKHSEKALNLILEDPEIKKVLLLRRNRIKSYVSLQIALKTKEWSLKGFTSKKTTETNRLTSIKVKPRKLQQYVEKTDRFYENMRQKLTASNQKYLEIAYEDMLGTDSEAIKAELLEFIGVSVNPEYLKSSLKKQNPQPLSQLVKNYSELESALQGTELEHYLHQSNL
ncbi:MAG: sulfotransferase [Cyanobacteriota bacterium]|nr:sulfotransferase [Cyanobacteriota bacterium]